MPDTIKQENREIFGGNLAFTYMGSDIDKNRLWNLISRMHIVMNSSSIKIRDAGGEID